MPWYRLAVPVLTVLLLLAGSWLAAGEKGQDRPPKGPPDPLKFLAEKLNLSADQQDKIRRIHAQFEPKLKELREQELKAVEQVLTEDQRAKFKAMRQEKIGGPPRPPGDK